MAKADAVWLPELAEWRELAKKASEDAHSRWSQFVFLANSRMDFIRVERLSTMLTKRFPNPPDDLPSQPIRLALLGSATMGHLHASLRVAALRHGLHLTIYENDYGQYLQELLDEGSKLHAFRPNVVLLALDAHHLTNGVDVVGAATADLLVAETMARIVRCWKLARGAFDCAVLHQTALPVFPPLLGNNEHRLPASKRQLVDRINAELRVQGDAHGVDIVALDSLASFAGLDAWHDPALWHRAKQEITPVMAPLYGALVARLIAAQQGRSAKCLVLDLDNTLWGGVVGDDGLDGIVLGQGDPEGEAFLAFQHYVKDLAKRGIIIAVCSKNDEANALEVFEKHPEMVLRRSDVACFKANWEDKASNLREIAAEVNIGLEALVFVDDNPFERALVRRELPMVAVPEMPEDIADYVHTLAMAGYFESVCVTEDDLARGRQYQQNREREVSRSAATDMGSYLRDLEMRLAWGYFDELHLQRIVQLINKTNQFNLTTRRYSREEAQAIIGSASAFGLHFRLVDRFGDNGVIGVVIGRMAEGATLDIDTWLMSCRVLGRHVEEAALNVILDEAKRRGARRIIGTFAPSAKNTMVRDHYEKLGFVRLEENRDGVTHWELDASKYTHRAMFMTIVEG